MKNMDLDAKQDIKARPWTEAEYAVLEGVINLIKARSENGYPELEEDVGIKMCNPDDAPDDLVTGEIAVSFNIPPAEDGREPIITVVPSTDFAAALVEELEEIQDGGATFLNYHIDEANGDVAGMMGLGE